MVTSPQEDPANPSVRRLRPHWMDAAGGGVRVGSPCGGAVDVGVGVDAASKFCLPKSQGKQCQVRADEGEPLLGVAVHTCNSRSWETEAGGSMCL